MFFVYDFFLSHLQGRDFWLIRTFHTQTSRRDQWVKVFVTKPDNLSSVPRIYMEEGKSQLLKMTSDLHISAVACLYELVYLLASTYTLNKM